METPSVARARVLDVAEQLFAERGYTAVTLRDVAAALGIRQASLYYHVPGGKEELYVAVTERNLARHRAGLEAAMAAAPPRLAERLRAAARWLLRQPPINLERMIRSDLPAISAEHARRLEQATFQSLLLPLAEVFQQAVHEEGIRLPHAILLANSFLAIIEGLQDARRYAPYPSEQLADAMITVLLEGLLPREPSPNLPQPNPPGS